MSDSSLLGLLPRLEFESLRRASFIFAVTLALFAILTALSEKGYDVVT